MENQIYEVDGVEFVREKQRKGEKGVCKGCAFNSPDTVLRFGEGCVKYGEICDVEKGGNMIVFKIKE